MDWGIIGGTGFYSFAEPSAAQDVATPFGEAQVFPAEIAGQEVAFLPRHGAHHALPPHLVNYRANIWALRALGVRRVLATAAVGSLNPTMRPGQFAVLDQFLDFTHGRPATLFQEEEPVVHLDMTEPYCPALRQALAVTGTARGRWLHDRGTYVCTEGPRFETAAEIRMFAQVGGDVVGMTGVPEVVLAREAGLCYACLAIITNWAAGIGGRPLTHEEVTAEMARQVEEVRQIFAEVIRGWRQVTCPCPGPAHA